MEVHEKWNKIPEKTILTWRQRDNYQYQTTSWRQALECS